MKKVIIEETITKPIKTGVGKHTIMLNNLIENLGYEYEIISNDFIGNIKNTVLKRAVFLIWLNTRFFFKLLFQKKGTIVIYTSFLPFIKLKKIKQIGIIHDVLLKKFPAKITLSGKVNNLILNTLLENNSDKILTVSQTVKEEIVHYYKIPKDKIHVLYNTFSITSLKDTDEDSILNKYNLLNLKRNYILSVSSLNKNKNIDFLINSFNKINKDFPDIKLVLIGNQNNNLNKYKNQENKNIIFTGYVSDDELAVLYKNALVYAFPSIYEGFGIPIIDAQYLGIPVICSDIPVFREVAGDGALFCELNIESFADGLNKLLEDEQLRSSLIIKGKENILRFSEDKLKEQLTAVL